MKDSLHLAMNLLIVAAYMMLTRDYLISFSDSSHSYNSLSEFVIACFIAATLVIYVSYPFDGTKSHRSEFSFLVLCVTGLIVGVDKLVF
jgi:hypothetical protein